jgi:hypothetical protein
MHLEGSAGGHTPPWHGQSAPACTSLGHQQTHHVRRAFPPFAGGPGLACRSCARVSFPAAGRRRQHGPLRARAPVITARKANPRRCVLILHAPMPFGFSSRSCFPGCVRHGPAWQLASRHLCRTVPNHSHPEFGKPLARLSWCGPDLRAASLLGALPVDGCGGAGRPAKLGILVRRFLGFVQAGKQLG